MVRDQSRGVFGSSGEGVLMSLTSKKSRDALYDDCSCLIGSGEALLLLALSVSSQSQSLQHAKSKFMSKISRSLKVKIECRAS